MGRKILKWVVWIFIGVAGLLLLVSILVYLPPVQRFVKNKAASIVADATGMQLSIDRFRLRFPLSLSIDRTVMLTAESDTLLRAGKISADVAFWPLLAGRIEAEKLGVTDAAVYYTDTLSALKLAAKWGDFTVQSARLILKKSEVQIGRITLSGADADLWMGESTVQDTVMADTTSAAWRIRLNRLDLQSLGFRMHTFPQVTELSVNLPEGQISKLDLDLGTQAVSVAGITLTQGVYSYLTDTTTLQTTEKTETADSTGTDSSGWNVRLDQLELSDNSFRYGVLNGIPAEGFDVDNLQLTQIDIKLSELYYRTNALGAVVGKLAFTERSGLSVTGASGTFAMDSVSLRLNDFTLQTAHSLISAHVEAAIGVLNRKPDASLSATLQADLGPEDFYYFYSPDDATCRTLAGQSLQITGDLDGTLSNLNISAFSAGIPGHIDLNLRGEVSNLLEIDHLAANVVLSGDFRDLGFLRPMLPDSLRERIAFPHRMALKGTATAAGSAYTSDLTLTADSGTLALKGGVDLLREKYNANITVSDFPLDDFLPKDTLGILSLDLTATGQGFDPRAEGAEATVNLSLNRFDYKNYTYRSITLAANLIKHQLHGKLSSTADAAKFDFELSGELSPQQYAARLTGRLDTLDLQRLGFMAEPFRVSLLLDADARYRPNSVYEANLLIDSVHWRYGFRTEHVGQTLLAATAYPQGITAQVRSGDLKLDFNSPESLDSLIGGFSRTASVLMAQVDSLSIDMEQAQESLPAFFLQANAKQDNVLRTLLSAQGIDFREINARITTMHNEPLRGNLVINSLKTSELTLDTLNVNFGRKDKELDYFVRLANRPGNIEQLALLAFSGYVAGNTAQADFYQRNRADSVGFRFGLHAELLDSAVRVKMTPEKPRLGYVDWNVNPDNALTYHFDRTFDGNLRLNDPTTEKHIYIYSSPLEPSLKTGALRIDMKGIDIASMLELLPSAPPISGILNTDLGFGFDRGQIVAGGSAGVDGLAYEKRPVGDIGAQVNFQSDSLNRFTLDAKLSAGGQQVLTAEGVYLTAESSLDFRAVVSSFPLTMANAFLPEDAAQLGGTLNGKLSVSGPSGKPQIDGQLNFADGTVDVPMIGTSYKLADTPIKLDNNILDLNRFAIISPDNQPFTLDGTFDLRNFSRIIADLKFSTRNFDVINAARRGDSAVTGKALMNVDLTAEGPIDALAIRGNLSLLRGTDIEYTVQDEGMEVESQKQDIVTFVDFNDPATFEPADSVAPLRVFGMDLLVNIDIEKDISATVNLSAGGSNRAELSGNGTLIYSMNPQGDSRFSGRFNVASGRILYTPPAIAQKDFAIKEDSYVDWTGDMLNPVFHITAIEQVRTTVMDSDKSTRQVNFDISIVILNSLTDLTFDLAAPNDAVIQAELASLTDEQRFEKAVYLLLFNTYSGPGSSGSADTNNALNTFIAKELNQWARNSLPNVDLSFGVDSYDDDQGAHTDYSYQLSKNLFSDRLKFTIGGSINPDAGSSENLQNNFVEDIVVEYRLTKSDNMFLKAYRYNTQESILEGEVVETGGGFMIQKQMNRLKDLFKSASKEQRRKLRQLKKEDRQEERDKKETAIVESEEAENDE